MNYKLLLYCFCIIRVTNLSSQTPTRQFESIAIEKGLSQNSVYDIAQDNLGFMWFATQDGLNKYDGKQMLNYYAKSSKSKQLNSSFITSLSFDSTDKKLWIATVEGICIYDIALDSFYNITAMIPQAEKFNLGTRSIKKIRFGVNHTLWAITHTDGIISINVDSKKVKKYLANAETKSSITTVAGYGKKMVAASFSSLFYYNEKIDDFIKIPMPNNFAFSTIKNIYEYHNTLWIATEYGGCYYINNLFETSRNLNKYPTPINGIGCFSTDNENNLWIGTRGAGLVFVNSAFKKLAESSNSNLYGNGLLSNYILSLYKDKQGIVWVGSSGGGIAKYDFFKQQFYSISHSEKNTYSLPDNMIFTIADISNGDSYYGSLTNGLIRYNAANNNFKSYKPITNNAVNDNSIYSIANDQKGNLWAAGYNGLFRFNLKTNHFSDYSNNTNLPTKHLTSVYKLKDKDSLLVSGDYGTIFLNLKNSRWEQIKENTTQLQKEDGLITRHFYEDEKDKNIIWLATLGEGLVKYNYKANTLEKIKTVYNKTRSLRYILQVESMFWLASDDGIFIYNREKDTIEKDIILAQERNGSNVCYALQKDNENNIWASSNKGLYKINLNTFSIKNYNSDNGLPFLEFNTAAVTKNDNTGIISFAGVGGIVSFNPKNIIENKFSPPPLITAITIANKNIESSISLLKKNKITLNYNQNFFTISFITTNFSSSEKINYAYKLEGIDANWVDVNNQNSANYTKITPGRYRFKVKSANSDMVWSTSESYIDVIIKPPFWQTWWFTSLVILIASIALYWAIQKRLQIVRADAIQQQKIIDLEKDKQLVSAEALLKGQEEERSRIAKDLHDGLGGMLSGVKISFSALKESLGLENRSSILFDKPIKQLDNTIAELRKVAHHLMPDALTKFGLKNAIDDFCKTMQVSGGSKIVCQQLGTERKFNDNINLNIYRIVQELINNAVKHANPTQILVQLTTTADKIFVTVEDDGKGFNIDTLQDASGIGYSNIKNRVDYLGGRIEIVSKINEGTVINIELAV